MTFENAITLIRDGKYLYLKIEDADNKRVFDLDGATSEDLISKLEQYKDILSSYGRLKFHAATESIKKQNWKGCYTWTIVFSGTPAYNGAGLPYGAGAPGTFPPSHYVSQNEAMLMAKLSGLEQQMAFDKRFSELAKKLEVKGFDVDKMIPFLPLLMDIPAEKLQAMMAMGQIQGMMNGTIQPQTQSAGMAGLQETKAEVHTTTEEKKMIDEINEGMGTLSEKVGLSAVHEAVNLLKDKPEMFNTLITIAKNFKQ